MINHEMVIFEESKEVKDLYKLILQYLSKNPTTAGHGFAHFVNVARMAYLLAVENGLAEPQKAYVAGLLHDIYRPALGEGGKEKHEEEASIIAGDLLGKSEFCIWKEEITEVIHEHDERILHRSATDLDKIISVADKINMSYRRGMAYCWACDRELGKEGKTAYLNMKQVIRDFCAYQVKAWKVADILEGFNNLNLALDAYIQTNFDMFRAMEDELKGIESYATKSKRAAELENESDEKYLAMMGATEEQIKLITINGRD